MTSLFTTQVPALPTATDGVPYELGMKFQVSKPGRVTAVRYYKSAGDTAAHVGRIWSPTGSLLAAAPFTGESASGWQQTTLVMPVSLVPGTTYVVSVNTSGPFPVTNSAFVSALTNAEITAQAGTNGVFGSPGVMPVASFKSSNYFRDIVFAPTASGALLAAIAAAQASARGSVITGVGAASIEARINVNGISFTGTTMATLSDPTSAHTINLNVFAKSAAGNPTTMPTGTITWTSSDPSVATVVALPDGSEDVRCTGKIGFTNIVATVGGLSTPPLKVTTVPGSAASLEMVVGIAAP